MPEASSSSSVRRRTQSTPSRRLRHSSSRSPAPGKRPAMPTTAMASASCVSSSIASPSASRLAQALHGLPLPAFRRLLLLRQGLDLLERGLLLLAAQVAGEGPDARMAEEIDDGQLAAQRLAQPAVGAHHEQGVSAEVEEVVVQADALHPQQLAPDTGDDALQL